MTTETIYETSFAFLITAENSHYVTKYMSSTMLEFSIFHALCIIIDMNNWNYMPGILFCLGIK